MTTDPSGASHTKWRAVDCHSHVLPQPYVERLGHLSHADVALVSAHNATTAKGTSRLPASGSEHLFGRLADRQQVLAASGIRRQILSAGSALAFPAETTHRAELVSLWNDSVHEEIMADSLAGIFRVFASVPLPDAEAAIQETHRVCDRETTVGFSITAHVLGVSLDSEDWRPLFSLWNEMGATVFVHPDRFRVRGLMAAHTEVDAGTQFDDTLATLQVTSPQIREAFPRIRWIVAHLGGAFSFLLERLDEHWERDRHLRPGTRRPSNALENVWFDTAGHGGSATRFAVGALGCERFVFGSDFPMLGSHHLELAVEHTRAALNDERQAARVLDGNIETLLPSLGRPADPEPVVSEGVQGSIREGGPGHG